MRVSEHAYVSRRCTKQRGAWDKYKHAAWRMMNSCKWKCEKALVHTDTHTYASQYVEGKSRSMTAVEHGVFIL